ncbi:MAG: MarR family winged helix-turn-helix transcriptional regulator [Methylomonas sp.]
MSYAARHVHKFELTLPQFDVIITLGNSPGMAPKKLGEKTLITKGTLTGVINRLEDKGLVQRIASKKDGRSQIIRLTEVGNDLYEKAFPEHLDHIQRIFKYYSPEDFSNLETVLLQLRKAIVGARCRAGGELANETSGWCTKIKGVCKHY